MIARIFLLLLLTLFIVDGFLPVQQVEFRTTSTFTTSSSSPTAMYGLFDGFIKSMESGYAGGEDSPYAKQKQKDAEKRAAEKAAFEEKKARGFKLLKDIDVKDKRFAETKYEQEEKEDIVEKWAKKQGEDGGFKFPWDK